MTQTPSVMRIGLLLGGLIGLTVIGSSAVAVALPELQADLGLDTAGTAWVLAAFALSFSVCTAVFGRVADLRGLRLPMRIGIVLFAGGSVVAGLAGTFPVLIVGRLLQGAGAGAVPVLSMGIVAARFSGMQRTRVIGGLVAVVSVLSASGPLLGGGLAQVGSWRAVLALPVVSLALGQPIARLAPAKPTARGRLDIRGALLVAVTMTGLVVLLQVPALRPPAPVLAVVACLALVGGAGLFWHVGRRPHGLLPIRVLTDRTVMLSAVTGWALLASYIGMLLALPLLLAAERGWSPLQIGLALLPAAAVGAVASRLTSPLEMRFGIRPVATGFACLSLVGVVTAAAAPGLPVVLVAGMGMVVAGFAGGQAVLLDAVTSAVDERVRGAALGVFNLVFFTGGAFGAAAVGGVADLLGLPAALGVLAAAPLIGVLMASRLPVVAPGAGPDIPRVEHPSLPTS